MIPRTRRRLTTLAFGTALALALTGGTVAAIAAPGGSPRVDVGTDAVTAQTGHDSGSALVQLSAASLATDARTTPAHGRKLDLTTANARAVRADLAQQRNDLRAWLRANAPKAKVTGEYEVAVNAVAVRLNGTSLETLRSAPGVVAVEYQALYTPLAHQDPDLALIDGPEGWAAAAASAGSEEKAGTGVKVAIIDSGIDVTHPCFDDVGFGPTPRRGEPRLTNNKVVVAKVFNNKAANQGLTAEAIDSHGTHVAATVACNAHTPASVQGADIAYDPSGVAPGAQLGNYNVFPGSVGSARSEDILNALDAAAADGMTVINMSLGGGASGIQDLLTVAVDNLDRANIVVAVAAGNSGPGRYTVGSPGSAARALTAGASTVGHYVGTPIRAGAGTVAVAAIGDFPTPDADITGRLAAVAGQPLVTGCSAADFGDVTGAVALISRGVCSFGTKVHYAERAGAIAAVIVNSVAGDPIAMAEDPTFPSTIPAVMAGLADRDALLAQAGKQVTMGAGAAYTTTGNDNIMAAFSSQGPTDVDFRVKPDVVAPGVNVLSSVPGHTCEQPETTGCWAFFQGTSMAAPHLAGMAAVVRQAQPAWDAWQVRSAIVNTSQRSVLTRSSAIASAETAVQVIGSGLADLDAAVEAQVAVSSVSTSFGAVPAGSGRSVTRTVTVTNLTDAALTLPVSVESGDGAFEVSPASLSLTPGSSQVLTLTFAAGRDRSGEQQATLWLGDAVHSVLFALLR